MHTQTHTDEIAELISTFDWHTALVTMQLGKLAALHHKKQNFQLLKFFLLSVLVTKNPALFSCIFSSHCISQLGVSKDSNSISDNLNFFIFIFFKETLKMLRIFLIFKNFLIFEKCLDFFLNIYGFLSEIFLDFYLKF